MDINIAIHELGLDSNEYKLNRSNPPHYITEWNGEDEQPTEQAMKEAYNGFLVSKNITDIKKEANELIYSKYPLWKQINIIREKGENLITMSTHIDNIRNVSNQAEENGTSIENIEWNID